MKYRDLVLNHILNEKDWKSTSNIRKEAETKAKKSINWYSINYLLEDLLKEKKVEKIESNRVTLWRKK